MKINRSLIITGCVILGLYLCFLLLPLIVSPVLNSFNSQITDSLGEMTGYKFEIEKLGVVTTPKLTVGLKVKSIQGKLPTGETFVSIDNLKVKLSLLPLIVRRIELDSVSVDSLTADLKVRNDGHLLIEEYLPQPDPDQATNTNFEMPFGLKLSNKLPDINVKKYNLKLTDMLSKKDFVISGDKFKISNFVLNKKIKLIAKGEVILDGLKQFTYDVKVFNRLMPDIDLNDLVFNSQQQTTQTNQSSFADVMMIFNALNKTQLSADVFADIKTSGTLNAPVIDGDFDVKNITMLVDNQKLPESFIVLKSKGNKISINSELYSAQDEKNVLKGTFVTGKHQKTNLSFKSCAKFNNLFRIANTFAKSFNYNDLETLSATGGIDADFSIKSNKKHVTSNGYLKIPASSLTYGLYNVKIDNIKADIDFKDAVNIKQFEFLLAGQPFSAFGTIKPNSEMDLHMTAQNLLIKGLVAATGQVSLLKENDFNSGMISLDATLTGKLAKIVPDVKIDINNVDIKNKPSDTKLILPNGKIVINTDGKKYNGNILITGIKILNPFIKLSVPKTDINIGEKDINISTITVLLNSSAINITGKIENYLKDNLDIKIKANGSLKAKDIKQMFALTGCPAFGSIPVSAEVSGNLKTQNIILKAVADRSNYISILDVDVLKNRSTVINSNIILHNDSIQLTNTGIFADNLNNAVVTLNGHVANLSSKQKLDLKLVLPKQISFSIPGFKKSKLTVRGDATIGGTVANPYLKGLISVPQTVIDDMAFTMKNAVLSLNGPVLQGNATVKSIKMGDILAENLASEISLKNYNILSLTNILGDAFGGKISGNVSYDIAKGKAKVSISGTGMDTLSSIQGSTGIKNALSGTLNFKANISTFGYTDIAIIKNLSGNINFDVQNGKFLNIGRFDNLVQARNVLANNILRTTVSGIVNQSLIQSTAEFKEIKGVINLGNGWAVLNPVTSMGPLMSYYITGKYNILNGTANIVVLGRLEERVVTALGPLGDLSVDTITSYIPKFGYLTSSIVRTMTTDPAKENTANIPALSSGSKSYKDFKVEFNGGVESKSSVKSFKWLSKCDTSAIDIKNEINNANKALNSAVSGAQKDLKDTTNELKNSINDSKKQLIDTKDELINLFKF